MSSTIPVFIVARASKFQTRQARAGIVARHKRLVAAKSGKARKKFFYIDSCSKFQIEGVRSVAHILAHSESPMQSHPIERRSSPRCDAVRNRSSIEVETAEGRQRIGATLVNVSRHGALVVTEMPVLGAVPISLRIESPVKTDWVDARIVRVDPDRTIGVHFDDGCPDDLLLAGTVGIDLAYLARNGMNGTTALD